MLTYLSFDIGSMDVSAEADDDVGLVCFYDLDVLF